jgi:hypothetical protein
MVEGWTGDDAWSMASSMTDGVHMSAFGSPTRITTEASSGTSSSPTPRRGQNSSGLRLRFGFLAAAGMVVAALLTGGAAPATATPGSSVLGPGIAAGSPSPDSTCRMGVVTKKVAQEVAQEVLFVTSYAARLVCPDGITRGWEARVSIQPRTHSGFLTIGKQTSWEGGDFPVDVVSEYTGAGYGYVLSMQWRAIPLRSNSFVQR